MIESINSLFHVKKTKTKKRLYTYDIFTSLRTIELHKWSFVPTLRLCLRVLFWSALRYFRGMLYEVMKCSQQYLLMSFWTNIFKCFRIAKTSGFVFGSFLIFRTPQIRIFWIVLNYLSKKIIFFSCSNFLLHTFIFC